MKQPFITDCQRPGILVNQERGVSTGHYGSLSSVPPDIARFHPSRLLFWSLDCVFCLWPLLHSMVRLLKGKADCVTHLV